MSGDASRPLGTRKGPINQVVALGLATAFIAVAGFAPAYLTAPSPVECRYETAPTAAFAAGFVPGLLPVLWVLLLATFTGWAIVQQLRWLTVQRVAEDARPRSSCGRCGREAGGPAATATASPHSE